MARNVDDLALLLSVIAGPDRRAPFGAGRPRPPRSPRRWPAPSRAARRDVASTSAARSRSTTRWPPWSRRRRARSQRRRHGGDARPRPVARPTTRSAPCAPGSSRRRSATCSPSTPTRSRPRWPTTSAQASALTGADVALAFERRTAADRRGCASSSSTTTSWCCRSPRCRRSRPTRSTRRDQRAAAGDLPGLDALGVPITATGCPAICVPAGTTRDGLPVGSRSSPRTAPTALLEIAAAFEAAVG